jgi:hypothetical protein
MQKNALSSLRQGGTRPVSILAAFLSVVALSALGGCAGETTVRQTAGEASAEISSGPTLYGQLGVSVDHVSTR